MNHLFVGSAIPFLIALAVYVLRRGRVSLPWLILTPFFMFLGATWAVIPDLPRTFGPLIPGLDRLIDWRALDSAMSSADHPWIDIFFWHYTLNRHESYSPWFNIGFVTMLLILYRVAWLRLRRLETQPPVPPSEPRTTKPPPNHHPNPPLKNTPNEQKTAT